MQCLLKGSEKYCETGRGICCQSCMEYGTCDKACLNDPGRCGYAGQAPASFMQTIKKAVEKSVQENFQENAQEGGQMSSIPMEALELFENVSYLMAKHADPAVPSTVEEWLDSFETFSIYTVFPTIEELWMANVQQLSTPAKK